jgi:hypothetical protein
MQRSSAIALGLSALVLGGVALSSRTTPAPRPAPRSSARQAFAARDGVIVRAGPADTTPEMDRLRFGSPLLVGDQEDIAGSGYLAVVRESVDGGVRFQRPIGYVAISDVLFPGSPPIASTPPRFGTVGGHHSLAETRDLLAVADYRFKQVAHAMEESRTRAFEPSDRTAFEADWTRLSSRWASARKEIARALILKAAAFPIFVSADRIPTEDEWVRTLSFVQGQELVRGSLQDITSRLETILGRKILFEGQPGQNAPDVDLDLFKDLDAQIRAGEAAARSAKEAADRATVQAILSPTGIALLAVGGGVLAFTFLPEIRASLGALRGSRAARGT